MKQQKQRSIHGRLRQNCADQLKQISQSIHNKGGVKRYDKVLTRIGRLKEKYQQIARYYEIHVEEQNAVACRIR